jgi:AraC-like DNA-binding protein
LAMPILRDERLLLIEHALTSNPGDARTLEAWAALVWTSPRTLARLFMKETSMSFGCWRDQFRALTALPRLVKGVRVTTLAAEFGYETPGAFAAMFKRVIGVAPTQYIAGERQ